MKFCAKVKPFPTFWGPIYKKYPDIGWNPYFKRSVLHWTLGAATIYSFCFGVGNILFSNLFSGSMLVLAAVLIGMIILATWKK